MPKETLAYLNFNRGIISPLASGRVDLKRTSVSAETMNNWMPRVFGSMSLRPGLRYLNTTNDNLPVLHIPFVYSTDDTAIIELTDENIEVAVGESYISRPTVATAVTNGGFSTDIVGWTDNDEAGGTSVWVVGGYMGLTGNGTAAAIRDQVVPVAAPDQNVEHALFLVIERGPVYLRVGTAAGLDEYINEIALDEGEHSLSFTPTGNFNIRLFSRLKRQVQVAQCIIDIDGVMYMSTHWQTDELDYIRYAQSGNVIYCTEPSTPISKIVRVGTRSWSSAHVNFEDGPFELINTSPTTISSSGISGDVTLTSSVALFRSTHVDALFKIISTGQIVTQSVTAQNVFTNAVRVTGVGSTRVFTIIRAGTWVATVTLQRSLTADTGPWEDLTTYTTNATITYDDALANVIAWYRIGVKTGNYTSGTVDLTLSVPTGSITGIAKITGFTSSTSVSAGIIQDLGGTIATVNWHEGSWSDYRGFPDSVAFVEGRLAFAGKNNLWISVSDAYESFDQDTVGDSGPIVKSIGFGPVDTINWLLPLQRLIMGGEGYEYTVKSNSLDEPLTPTNCMIKISSSQGSNAVSAALMDTKGIYTQRGGTRVMQLSIGEAGEYASQDLTVICPEVTSARVVRMAIQRQPDTRIHCVLNDGIAAIGIIDKIEDVLCWVKISTDGFFEDVFTLPGDNGVPEDKVYYTVRRTINGVTKRYLEAFSLESECIGGTLNKQLDSFKLYSGASTTTITGLSHLEAKSVSVWGNGVALGSYTVSGGQITGLTSAVTSAVVGLPYTAQWKSFKLGRVLASRKHVDHMGLIMRYTHPTGLQYGNDFTTMYDLPAVEDGTAISSTTIRTDYEEDAIEFPGTWSNDSRICLQAVAPKPCTIVALTIPLEFYG